MKFLIILLLLGACAPKEQTGSGTGFGGKLDLTITLDEDKITDIIVQNHNETAYVGVRAFPLLKEKIIAAQSPEVDNISGASFTSYAYKAAVAKAMETAGLQAYKINFNTKSPNPITLTNGPDVEVDVLVIGGGGAGLSAAISATEAGSKVMLIEKMPLLGGNTVYSAGGLNAAETSSQKASGMEDSKQVYYEDTMKGGKNINNPELVKILTSEGDITIDWLKDKGIDLAKVALLAGSSNPRAHLPADGSAIGPYLFAGLESYVTKIGVDIRPNTLAVALNINNGQIHSVKVESDTTMYTIKAKSVIIATGGFGANLEMVTANNPKLKGFKTSNHKGATGDIFPIVEKLGIQLKDMNQIQINPTGETAKSFIITEAVRGSGGIFVNAEGKRFINELGTRDVVAASILSQPKSMAFIVYDNQTRNALKIIENYEKLGIVRQAKTLEELAGVIKVPSAELQNTITSFNEIIVAQKDPLGRVRFAKPIEQGPFYAIAINPVIHHTMGGIAVNTESQVLLKNNTPVKGLYAAGEVVGGIHGANRLGGNAISDITTFGRRSGERAAKFAQEN